MLKQNKFFISTYDINIVSNLNWNSYESKNPDLYKIGESNEYKYRIDNLVILYLNITKYLNIPNDKKIGYEYLISGLTETLKYWNYEKEERLSRMLLNPDLSNEHEFQKDKLNQYFQENYKYFLSLIKKFKNENKGDIHLTKYKFNKQDEDYNNLGEILEINECTDKNISNCVWCVKTDLSIKEIENFFK